MKRLIGYQHGSTVGPFLLHCPDGRVEALREGLDSTRVVEVMVGNKDEFHPATLQCIFDRIGVLGGTVGVSRIDHHNGLSIRGADDVGVGSAQSHPDRKSTRLNSSHVSI